MELELGLKITKTRDDIDSISEYQFMKDTGPVFRSRETNTMFILTAHLKGYKKNNIDIKISKDGSKISISGKKPIQEMVMMGWIMQRKVVDVKGFNKVLKIPYGVNLDKIKANYNEEEWMLNIVMPKLVKGISGLIIEEFKEQEFDKERTKQEKSDIDHVSSSVGETSQKGSEINEERMQEEVGEYKLRIDGNGESVREKGGKEEYEVMKKSEIDQSVGEFMSKEVEDTSQDKEFEDQKVDSRIVDKRLDDVNRDKKINEESMLRIEDSKVKDIRDKDVGKSISQNIVDTSHEEYEKPPFETNEDVKKTMFGDTKEIIKPSEEGFDHAKITINEEFPKNLLENSYVESEGLNNQKIQETKNEKEEMASKEVEYFVEKGEGEKLKRMHVEAKKGNNPRETIQKKIEENDNGIKGNGQEHFAKIEESKGFNVVKEEEQKQDIIEPFVVNENFIVEGDESNERTKEKVQNEEDKIEYGIVKSFEGENDGNKIFDERKTQKFQEVEQIEHVNENGANIEKSIKKLNRDNYEKMQNEENEGFKKIKTKEKDELFLQEEMSKGRSKATKAAKEDFPMKMLDSPIDTREGLKPTRERIKESAKESSMEPFEANEEIHKEFKKPEMEVEVEEQECAKEKPNKEGFDAKINEEIQKYIPKSTHEESDGLNVEKMQETKDVKEIKGKKVEYFVEKGEGDRLKRGIKDVEKSENGKKQSGQNHASENTIKEMCEVSKSKIKEFPQQVAEIDGSKELDVDKEEEQNEVVNEAFVESESLMEKARGEESKRGATKTIVQLLDREDKIAYGIDKLKGNGSEKIHFEPNEPFPKDTTKDKIEKEGKGFKKNITKKKDEHYFPKKISEGRYQATKDAEEDFPMKMLDLPIDTREGLKDRKMEETKVIKEECQKVLQFVKEEKHEKILVESNEGLSNDINKETTQKEQSEEPKNLLMFKDQQCLQEEMNKVKNVGNTLGNEFPMQTKDSIAKTGEGTKDKEIEEQKISKSTTKEGIQGSEIETISRILFEEPKENIPKEEGIRTPKRKFQSVASMGFSEFDYGNAKDKKQKTKMLPQKFLSKETQESKDESANQDTSNPKKQKEVGTIEDQVLKPLPEVLRFQSTTQQSEVQEKIKSCEGDKEKYKGSLESIRDEPTKDNQNLIEMKEILKQENPLQKELKKGETDEFHNGEKLREAMQEKNDESKNKIDDKDQQYVVQDTEKVQELRDGKDGYIDEEAEEIKSPKILAYQEAKPPKLQRQGINQQSTDEISEKSECDVEEHEVSKESPKINIVESEKIDKVSGSKRAREKVHENPKREDQRELEDVTSKSEVEPPNIVEKTSKEKAKRKIPHELEATMSKEKEEKGKQYVPEKNDEKGFQTQETLEEEKVVEKKEEPMVAKSEETKDDCTLKAHNGKSTQALDENMLKMKEITTPFNKGGSESKRVGEKVHETPKREQPNVVEKTPTNIDSELPKVEEFIREEVQRHIHEVEANISKEKDGVETEGEIDKKQLSHLPSPKEPFQQFEVEDKGKINKKDSKIDVQESTKGKIDQKVEQCINKDEEAKHGTKKQKEDKDETSGEIKKDNEILKVEKEKKVEKHIHVQEATIFKEKDRVEQKEGTGTQQNFTVPKNSPPKEHCQSMEGTTTSVVAEKVVQQSNLPSSSCTQQFEVEGEKKTKKKESKIDVQDSKKGKIGQEVEQCINKDEEAKHGTKEQKEGRDETSGDMKENEIPKVEKEKKVERHIHLLEATISKEKDRVEQKEGTSIQQNSTEPKNSPPKEHCHSMEGTTTLEVVPEKVVQQSNVPSSSCTQQFEVEGEEKSNNKKESKIDQEIEQCINKDEQLQYRMEENEEEQKNYEQVYEEQKEGEDETSRGKKNSSKLSKELFVPLVIAGSALIVTLIAIFVRHRRTRKR